MLSHQHPISALLIDHPELFHIVTPINVSVFCSYLNHHPNKCFCESVCKGLVEGFWLWADIEKEGYLIIHDESHEVANSVEKSEFI
jgi:hypothetical protein